MRRSLILLPLGGLLCSMLWSFWRDSLRAFLTHGDYTGTLVETAGFSIALGATGIMAYRGFLFVRGAIGLFGSVDFRRRVHVVQHREQYAPSLVSRARRENLLDLWRVARRPLPWIVLGFAVLAVGGSLIRQAEGHL